MRRAARSEPERARKKVLLVDELQHHDNRPLTYLILEGWKAKGAARSIRLRNICSPDRRRLLTARLDATSECQEMALEFVCIFCRRHTVDAGSTILAGESVGFLQPFQIEDVVQCGQSHPSLRSCQFSYPLPFRGQVCKAHGPLPCFPSAVLSARRTP